MLRIGCYTRRHSWGEWRIGRWSRSVLVGTPRIGVDRGPRILSRTCFVDKWVVGTIPETSSTVCKILVDMTMRRADNCWLCGTDVKSFRLHKSSLWALPIVKSWSEMSSASLSSSSRPWKLTVWRAGWIILSKKLCLETTQISGQLFADYHRSVITSQ